MQTQQIYNLVNSVNQQSEGKIDITVTDTASLVSLGDAVLSGNNTEPFLNSLCQLIYRDIIEGRAYKSPLRSLMKGSAQWGAIVRKISVDMPELVEEKAVPLADGPGLDQYQIKLPKAHQHLYVSRTPYSAFVTIQRAWLKEAFRNEEGMEQFIAMIFLKIQNRLELSIENLTKMAVANYIGLAKESQTFNLVTLYNAEVSEDMAVASGLQALHNPAFMRWAVGFIKEVMSNIASMSTLYNYDGEERFTPYRDQHLMMLSRFKTQLETTALYGAFNEEYINIVKKEIVPHWQGSGTEAMKFDKQSAINVKVRTPGSDTTTQAQVANVVAVLFDDEAVGAYRQINEVATTPLNARGLYTNTWFHEQQMWFNATDENLVVFTLN